MGENVKLNVGIHTVSGSDGWDHNFDIDLYEASKKRMSMESLQKAVRKLAEVNLENLWDIFDEDDDEIIEIVVKEVATDKVLEYINNHLRIMPVFDLFVFDDNYTNYLLNDELNLGHHIEIVPKLFKEPVVLVGEQMISGGCSALLHASEDVSFVTADGEWKFAHRRSYSEISQENSEDDVVRLDLYEPAEFGTFSIERLADLIPEKYEFVLYG